MLYNRGCKLLRRQVLLAPAIINADPRLQNQSKMNRIVAEDGAMRPEKRKQRRDEMDVLDFSEVYTERRQEATLEVISQMLFFADKAATKGFGRESTKKDLAMVKAIKHSANWADKKIEMSTGTIVIIRQDMETAGLFEIVTGAAMGVWGKVRSPITTLKNIDLVGLANLARQLFCSLCQSIGYDALSRDHNWGGLAAIVMKLTGCSLFSMDDDYSPDEDENDRRKGERMLQAIAELENCRWAGLEYRELVSDRLARQFGPDWMELLPY